MPTIRVRIPLKHQDFSVKFCLKNKIDKKEAEVGPFKNATDWLNGHFTILTVEVRIYVVIGNFVENYFLRII